MKFLKFCSVFIIITLLSPLQPAQEKTNENDLMNSILHHLEDINISGQWFLGYQSRDISDVKSNEFLLKRGYITFQKKFSDNFTGRITQDISVDQEGDGLGDVELRLKYGYLRFKSEDFLIFTDPFVEFGLVHRPWLDFEQKINRYRVQGSMFLDRNDILSSADYGITITSLLGGEIDKEYQESVNDDYPGKYGSFTLGIYNGGGYHAIEQNQNKLFEGRLSLRPLPEVIPGIQISYVKVLGKGNISSSPDFNLDLAGISFENELVSLLGYYIKGIGDQSGNFYSEYNKNIETEGFSIFGEFKLNFLSTSIFGRYDQFEYVQTEQRKIIGIAYHFLGRNKILIDYDLKTYDSANLPDDHILEFAIELRF